MMLNSSLTLEPGVEAMSGSTIKLKGRLEAEPDV